MEDSKQNSIFARAARLLNWLSVPGWVSLLWKWVWKLIGWLGNWEFVQEHWAWIARFAHMVNPPALSYSLPVIGVIWLVVVVIWGESLRQRFKPWKIIAAVVVSMLALAALVSIVVSPAKKPPSVAVLDTNGKNPSESQSQKQGEVSVPSQKKDTQAATTPGTKKTRKQKQQRSATAPPPPSAPLGKTGISVAPNSFLHMQDSQVAGYQNGINEGKEAIVDMNHSQVSSEPSPMPTPSTQSPYSYQPASGGLYNITLAQPSPAADLPQKIIPYGGSPSKSSTEEQGAIVNTLREQWRKDNLGRSVRKQAFIWINQQLEAQGKDFRIEIPTNCPPLPNAPAVAVAVGPGHSMTIDGSKIEGFENGAATTDHANLNLKNTEIVSADHCD